MSARMPLLACLVAAGVLLPGAARAQYADPYALQRDFQDEDDDFYQPPAEGQVVQAGSFTYGDAHPIPYDVGQGYCETHTVHVHDYAPFDVNLFRRQNNAYYFVGDPFDFGYTQSLYWYRGNHPLPLETGGGYCFMGWPHRHGFAPAGSLQPYYRNVGGYLIYRGPWDDGYYRGRDRFNSYWNDYYRSHYYGNRYYRVRPQHVWGWGAPRWGWSGYNGWRGQGGWQGWGGGGWRSRGGWQVTQGQGGWQGQSGWRGQGGWQGRPAAPQGGYVPPQGGYVPQRPAPVQGGYVPQGGYGQQGGYGYQPRVYGVPAAPPPAPAYRPAPQVYGGGGYVPPPAPGR